ncbi:hypothetical protein [Mycobacterium ostraviense]|uniref:PknH-like extracellular domain-containing protein n=1 Tax=Mycobacterium ostraviense TaxID=2738409 RepID=A0A163XVG1_9MYCO|nr:hypothetical protein [Mycobacterium ostraviense]KZS59800.1 hypothetical protein A4G28_01190 [Mycobacterium ostraviense]UGT93533.1 hypothetical protein LTS72_09920 [Mycobacterium ostraviense]
MGSQAAGPAPSRSQPWPRVVGGAALAVLGACGAALLVTAPRSDTAPANLASRTDWDLATALPAGTDFPSDWGYSLTGRLRRAATADPGALTTAPHQDPAAAYEPGSCGDIPEILDHAGGALAAYVQVDRYAQLFVQDAAAADFAATGEGREHGPNARFAIWVVSDAAARIANYLDWLGRCGSYRVTNYFFDGRVKNHRTVTTQVGVRSAAGADAAVTVTRTFTTIGSRDPSSTYHVTYYAVRGVLLECTIYMEGPELDLVQKLAGQTLQRLRAL